MPYKGNPVDNQPDQVNIQVHEGQYKVLTSQKRFILALAGIQGGKTWSGCLWSQQEIERNPKGNHLITALSHDQVDNVILNKFFELFPGYRDLYNKKEKKIYLPTGGFVFFRSLEDPKYVEGITAHSAWIDEADLAGERAYRVVRGRVNATGGRILMTSSIADNSWLTEYMDRMSPKLFEIINWPSSLNPAFSNDEWEALKHELDPALFRRRYEADPFFASGKVYGEFDVKKHELEKVPDDDPIDKHFLGMDWGYNDPTAAIVVGLSVKKNVYILDEFVSEGVQLDDLVNVMQHFKRKYEIRSIYADPSNKLYLKEVQRKAAMMIQPGQRDIAFGTGFMRNLIHQDRFFIIKGKAESVKRELRMYRFKENLNGRSEEPADANNHTMDAIRYVVATYPIPRVIYKKKEMEAPMPDFWMRRTKSYQRLARQEQATINTGADLWTP